MQSQLSKAFRISHVGTCSNGQAATCQNIFSLHDWQYLLNIIQFNNHVLYAFYEWVIQLDTGEIIKEKTWSFCSNEHAVCKVGYFIKWFNIIEFQLLQVLKEGTKSPGQVEFNEDYIFFHHRIVIVSLFCDLDLISQISNT